MIFVRLGRRAVCFRFREAERNTLMKPAARLNISRRAIFFLFVSLGLSNAIRAGTLEDSAKELARELAAALPVQTTASCEIRNRSSLLPEEVSRVERGLDAELQDRGVRLSDKGAETAIVVTLSENFENLVWTAEIRKGGASQVVVVAVERPSGNHTVSSAMPVTIHSEKFWEGPERILDAGELSDGAGKSWQVVLLPDGLRIQDKQGGATSTTEITSLQGTSRDPWGNLNFQPTGNSIGVFLAPRVCAVNLEPLDWSACLTPAGSTSAPPPGRTPVMFDVAPAIPPPPGKGTLIEMQSVCGGANQFLATGAGDYTQTDSLQVFQAESSGAVAVSAELDFPGPITALHATSATPRAVVRNLTTGNYEAYRLSFSCGQ